MILPLDLAGYDLDVSRFIRETSEHSLQVFWRNFTAEHPPANEPSPQPNELCSVPVWEVQDLLKRRNLAAWLWDHLEGAWSILDNRDARAVPGTILLIRAADGFYTPEEGWNPASKTPVTISPHLGNEPQSYTQDPMSETTWVTLADHTNQVVAKACWLVDSLTLPVPWRDWIINAARWHDAGKSHHEFQHSLRGEDASDAPTGFARKECTQGNSTPPGVFPGLRHELASGVLAIIHGQDDAVAYLAACHHGKVRLSLRALPIEKHPPIDGQRFARGIWDGDQMPEVDLGGGVTVPPTIMDLSLMELGDGRYGPSWTARMLALRNREDVGIFRLAYLEALVKVADERASRGD